MKKLFAALMALTFVLGTAAVTYAPTAASAQVTKEEMKKDGKKSKGDKGKKKKGDTKKKKSTTEEKKKY